MLPVTFFRLGPLLKNSFTFVKIKKTLWRTFPQIKVTHIFFMSLSSPQAMNCWDSVSENVGSSAQSQKWGCHSGLGSRGGPAEFSWSVQVIYPWSVYPLPQAHREGGDRRFFPRAFILMIFTFMGCNFTLFLYLSLSRHCLDSKSERLGKIISNSLMVSVDKLFDACKHVKPTLLIDHAIWIIN